jgi:hypothetical protein
MRFIDVILQENEIIKDKFLYCNRNRIITEENYQLKHILIIIKILFSLIYIIFSKKLI